MIERDSTREETAEKIAITNQDTDQTIVITKDKEVKSGDVYVNVSNLKNFKENVNNIRKTVKFNQLISDNAKKFTDELSAKAKELFGKNLDELKKDELTDIVHMVINEELEAKLDKLAESDPNFDKDKYLAENSEAIKKLNDVLKKYIESSYLIVDVRCDDQGRCVAIVDKSEDESSSEKEGDKEKVNPNEEGKVPDNLITQFNHVVSTTVMEAIEEFGDNAFLLEASIIGIRTASFGLTGGIAKKLIQKTHKEAVKDYIKGEIGEYAGNQAAKIVTNKKTLDKFFEEVAKNGTNYEKQQFASILIASLLFDEFPDSKTLKRNVKHIKNLTKKNKTDGPNNNDSKADKTGTNETDGPNNNNKIKADNDNKNNNNTKAKVDTPDDIISNSTPDKISTGKESTIYYRNGGGGFDQVNADFDSMNLKNVRELNYPDGSKGRMGTLPDGRNVLTRPSSKGDYGGPDGPPTLEIHSKRPNGKVRITKVRY